jgi:hypothetical protein
VTAPAGPLPPALAQVVAALKQAGCRRGGPRGAWQCPAHDDHTPSLSVHQGHDGRVLLHCHAGCPPEQVAAALGLAMRELFGEPDQQADDDWTPRGPAIATYQYTDEAGRLLFAVCRTADKQFPQWRPDPSAKTGRRWSLKDPATGKPAVRLVPYRLPKVLDAAAQGGTVYVVEGEKDVHAIEAAGGVATCNPGGAGPGRWREEYAAALVGAGLVVVVADRDPPDPTRPANSYKGQRHARRIARSLAKRGIPTRLVVPAAGKDAADHLAAGHGLDDFLPLPDSDTPSPAGADPTSADSAADTTAAGEPPPAAESGAGGREDGASTATALVALATDRYQLATSATGDPFAVARAGHGPHLARMLRGGQASLRAELAAAYARHTGRVPNSSALADALNVLEGIAIDRPPVELALRVARHGDGLVLDLGDPTGRVVVLDPAGWQVVERSPVLFRRTKLTGILPQPARGGRLETLRELGLVNLSEQTWPLAVAWLVAALVPDIAHPIPLLVGEQGTGKSTTARLLSRLVDPSPAELRSAPKDLEQWAVAASGSWLVVLDNVSAIPDWLSDALCRAVTGDGMVRRRLYENDDLAVLAFRRVVALTSIDPGALRGDLADRIVMFDLDRFARRGEELHLDAVFRQAWPGLLGGLCDLACQVLATLPTITVDRPPRMADFARIVAATDHVLGTGALGVYRALSDRLAEGVIDADPVATALRAFVTKAGSWEGTASELLGKLTADRGDARPPRQWPATSQAMGAALRRAAPSLRQVGIAVEQLPPRGHARQRGWWLSAQPDATPPADPTLLDASPAAGRGANIPTRAEESGEPMPATSATSTSGQPSRSAAWEGADIAADDMGASHDPNVRTRVPNADIPQSAGGAMSAQCPHPETPVPAGQPHRADDTDVADVGSPLSSGTGRSGPASAPRRRVAPGSVWARNGAPELAPDRFTYPDSTSPPEDPGRWARH